MRHAVREALAGVIGGITPRPNRSLAVLTYHSVGSADRDSTLPARFREHLRTIVNLPALANVDWRNRTEAAQFDKACLITFDDGYLDNLEIAAPILEEFGLRALFFITAGFVEGVLDITRGFKSYRGLAPMTWDQVGALVERGHSVGVHSYSHASMASLPLERAREELQTSVDLFNRRLGVQPDSFAYPFGQIEHRSRLVAEAAREIGLPYVFSTDHKLADLEAITPGGAQRVIPRLSVSALDTPANIRQKIAGDWDYVFQIQRVRASVKTRSLGPLIRVDY